MAEIKAAVRTVPTERLQLSKAPHAELTAAAVEAARELDPGGRIGEASYAVVACSREQLDEVEERILDLIHGTA